MTKSVPKWIQERYATLWRKLKDKEITFKKIEKTLKNKKGINMFLSELSKSDWIEVRLSKEDKRKRTYRLRNPDLIIREMK